MNKKEFIKLAENYIYKEIAKNSNLLFGKNKTSALSTGLFLKLPIEITLEKVNKPFEQKLLKELHTMGERFSAYVKTEDTVKVYFTFFYYDEKDIKALANNLQYRSVFFTFVYMHELQHILRKHITKSYHTMMLKIADKALYPNQLINIAEDYAINYSLKDLFTISKLNTNWIEIERFGLYNNEYHKQEMSDIDILKDLLENGKKVSITSLGNGFEEVSIKGKKSIQPETSENGQEESNGNGSSNLSDDLDISLSDLSESLQNIIKDTTKGTKAGELIEKMFNSIKINVAWFKKIKNNFKRHVYYKTHDFSTNWSNLNNTYRKIYKSPKKEFIDNRINIILSVDHSGSVVTEELQKLLYLIESESKKINKLTVLIHDTRVVKTFILEDEYDISKSPEFKKALSTRHVVGGTSHDDVFKTIQKMKIKDPNQMIYMSFSDNYSDIEETIGKYSIMKKLTNYWVCTINNPVKVNGTNILIN